MQTIIAYGRTWVWNESLTVNVWEHNDCVYCYTLGEPTRRAFVESIPDILEYWEES